MKTKHLLVAALILSLASSACWAQGVQPDPNVTGEVQQQTAQPTVQIKILKGAANVRVDGASEVLQLSANQDVSFDRTIEVSTPGAFASISVDFGDNGFIRIDYGRADINLDRDGTIRVHSYDASIYADTCKNLIREGQGRWIIVR